VRNDEELNRLMAHCTISEGGVIPTINPALLPGKTGKGKEGGVEPSQEV
jgi:histone H2A